MYALIHMLWFPGLGDSLSFSNITDYKWRLEYLTGYGESQAYLQRREIIVINITCPLVLGTSWHRRPIQYIVYDMMYTIRYMIYDICYTLHDIRYMLYTTRYTLYAISYTLYAIRHTIHDIRNATLYWFTIYNIWYTIYHKLYMAAHERAQKFKKKRFTNGFL